MRTSDDVKSALKRAGVFSEPGATVLVDGQFGSTGKGLMAAVLAETGNGSITDVVSNAGPNSGHTAYSPVTGEKIVVTQLPVAGVVLDEMLEQLAPNVVLCGGAIIDPVKLIEEVGKYLPHSQPMIHPCAAIIGVVDQAMEQYGGTAAIASTGKGVGAALARKITREGNVANKCYALGPWVEEWKFEPRGLQTILMEIPQGFSLGINTAEFYPHTTSRECTVAQGLADARIPAQALRSVVACYRTFPIRVGNTAKGHSGGCYSDQVETSWKELELAPEYTTVTGRERRVFTWSDQQFVDSVKVNMPDVLFLNFMNYLDHDEERLGFVDRVCSLYFETLGCPPDLVLGGYGPLCSDVRIERYS